MKKRISILLTLALLLSSLSFTMADTNEVNGLPATITIEKNENGQFVDKSSKIDIVPGPIV